jgi:hypothetical protein
MKLIQNSILALPVIAASAMGSPSGAKPSDPVTQAAPAPEASNWEFRLEPYGWLTALEGKTGVAPLVADVDQSFSDIFDNLETAVGESSRMASTRNSAHPAPLRGRSMTRPTSI